MQLTEELTKTLENPSEKEEVKKVIESQYQNKIELNKRLENLYFEIYKTDLKSQIK